MKDYPNMFSEDGETHLWVADWLPDELPIGGSIFANGGANVHSYYDWQRTSQLAKTTVKRA